MKVLTGAIVVTVIGGTAGGFALAAPGNQQVTAPISTSSSSFATLQTSTTLSNTDLKSLIDKSIVNKEETAYVIANTDGSVKKIIVSNWLKNPQGDPTLSDLSDLKDITNVKGDEQFTVNSDNSYVWDAKGNDIYYQGTSEKELPVSMTVSYLLDGNTISAEELAGKSGKVTIHIDYTNHQKQTVTVDGVEKSVYVPFAMVTGMILDNNIFTNVQVSNANIVNDGDKSVVVGFALPGMQENLGISTDKFEIPESFEVTADVKDFALTTTLTIATNEIFNHLNFDGVGNVDELTSSLTKLTDASNQLMDGSKTLSDGLSTLLTKSQELVAGIDKLATGANALSDGAATLSNGAGDLKTGLNTLNTGLQTLNSNSDKLDHGAKAVFESLLSMADQQLAAAGLSVPKLTIENYATTLQGVTKSLNKDDIYKLAYNTALKKVTAAVNAKESEVRTKVEAVVKSKVLVGVLKAVGKPMTAEDYATAVTAGMIPKETQAQINAAIEKQMKTAEIQAQISAATKEQITKLIEENMKSKDVTSQIEAAVAHAASGAGSINALITQLNSYNQFYQGLDAYTDGVAQATEGSEKLTAGAVKLSDGAKALANGSITLSEGIGTLKDGSFALIEGVQKLSDGALKLSGGMKEFNDQGIKKIVDAFDGDLSGLITNLRATAEASKSYQSFSGILDDQRGSIKFIYKTDSIEKTE